MSEDNIVNPIESEPVAENAAEPPADMTAQGEEERPVSSRSSKSVKDQDEPKDLSRQGSSKSLKSNRSAKSAKSVAFSTAASDKDLIEEEESDKQNCCVKIVSGMWASREMLKDNKDQQLYVKTTLRELFLYTIFMFVICYATFSQYSPTNYRYTDMVRSLFTKQMDVTNYKGFWKFVEGELIEGLYWETWYNKGYRNAQVRCPDGEWATKPCKVPPSDRNVMYENRVLGLPRIRQIKVHNISCSIPEDFKKAIRVCFAPYSESGEDQQRYDPDFRKYTAEEAWLYQSGDILGSAWHSGQISSYSGAGYSQTLHYLKNETYAIVAELKQGLWITQGTRFVSIDFTVYNANINLFCVVKLSFEFPATGGVIPMQTFTTVKLLKYTDGIDYFLMACEFIFIIYIMYYIVEESLEIKTHKWRYFFNVWNLLDLVVIGISATQIFLNIFNLVTVSGLLRELLDKPFNYADFSQLANTARQLTILSAFNIFVAWIKVFKYLSFNKTMTQLSGTLSAATKDLSGFSVMFCIIYFAFVQLGYLLFGIQVRDFRSFKDSVFTLFRMILGDFNFKAIENASTVLGPIYFLSYIFFVFFVLLNMFLAIINDTYAEVKAEVKARKADFQMGDFFKTGANNVKGYLGIQDRGIDVENAIKLAAADDGFVTYDELRENLRKARFSDVEIDLFFHFFQNDPAISQIILDEEELKAKQLAEDKRRLSTLTIAPGGGVNLDSDSDTNDDDAHNKRPKTGKEARKMRSAKIKADAINDAPVYDDDFYRLQGRVDRMESSISPLAHKIDVVLSRLDSVYKKRKLKKDDMEKIFEGIVSDANADDVTKRKQMEELVLAWDESRPNSSRKN